MSSQENKVGSVAESDEALQAFVADPNWVHFVGALVREQLGAVFTELENAHYPPGTPKNDLFHLRIMNWEEMQWVMVSIPAADKGLMEAAAAKHGMRVADGVPILVSAEGIKRFPADNDRVFHLAAALTPRKADVVRPASKLEPGFISSLPLLKTQQERDVAHKLVDILKPFKPEDRGALLKQALDRVGDDTERAEWNRIQGLPPRDRDQALSEAMTAYELGKAEGSALANTEWARIRRLPMSEQPAALRKAIDRKHARVADLNLKEAKLESDLRLLNEIIAWLEKPLVLQHPQGSAWHKIQEANKAGTLFTLKSNGDALGTATLDGANGVPNVFVVEHDWASAFANATDFEGGAVRLPFDLCVFEFQLSGRRVCVLLGQSDKQDSIGQGLIFLAGSNGAWCVMGPPQSDGALSALISQQVRAVCIALDAEVAISEVERAPAKLNEARAKKGKPLLKDYHVVSLARRTRAPPLPRTGDEPAFHKRLHFVRGHWRHYQRAEKDFKSWIKWHLRGNPDLGFIDKHYKL